MDQSKRLGRNVQIIWKKQVDCNFNDIDSKIMYFVVILLVIYCHQKSFL